MKNPGSILRVKHFSDSEEEDFNVEPEEDQAESDEQMEEESEEPGTSKASSSKQIKSKTRKKGIIYISTIPRHMNVAICREFMEQFGEVGRLFLQPDSKGSKFSECLLLMSPY